MNIIALIGRTCSGKSSLSKRISAEFVFPTISVGSLIRNAAEEDKTVHEQYIGPDGFSDVFVASLISRQLFSLGPINSVVIEGSIGLGLALEEFQKVSGTYTIIAFHLECPLALRFERFNSRNKLTNRQESPTFFREREQLFDLRLGNDFEALKRVGTLFAIDCEDPIEVCLQRIRRILIDRYQISHF